MSAKTQLTPERSRLSEGFFYIPCVEAFANPVNSLPDKTPDRMKNKLRLHSCILKCVNYGLLPSLLMNVINRTFSKQHSTTLLSTLQHFNSWSTR